MINGSQMTIVWHVDDLKVSHLRKLTLLDKVKWLESIYGPLVGCHGESHTYLGMDMHFANKRLQVSMIGYLHEIVDEFPYTMKDKVLTPAAPPLFEKNENVLKLDPKDIKIFHHIVAKVLWAAIRVRPDLLTALSYLSCQVKSPDKDDLKKLCRIMGYIKDTIDLPLRI
jgi:hypothetical protein